MKIRVTVKYLPLLLVLLSMSMAPSCSNEGQPIKKETFVMGTKAWITIYSKDRRKALKSINKAFRELYSLDARMSNWKESSEISILNSSGDGKPHKVSKELFAVIDTALNYSRITDGAFDITARPIVTLWGFEGGKAELPEAEEIEKALKTVGYQNIVINRDSMSVRIPQGFELDLAGIAKGYAIDRCKEILKADGFGSALINLGGNIYAIGAPPGKKGWKIGIRDPLGSTDIVGMLSLKDMAVATSGDYENFVELGGKRYGHIVDPKSGYPVEGVLSVTVVAPTAIASDALSTGLFVLGPDKARSVVESLKDVSAVFALPTESGKIEYKRIGSFNENCTLELKE